MPVSSTEAAAQAIEVRRRMVECKEGIVVAAREEVVAKLSEVQVGVDGIRSEAGGRDLSADFRSGSRELDEIRRFRRRLIPLRRDSQPRE